MTDVQVAGPAGNLAVRAKGLDLGRVVILVQGANLTGQTGYDFQHPGGYSMMDALVAKGLGAVTFSIRGYGASDPPPDPLEIDTNAAIADLTAVSDWVINETGADRHHLLGWSWGGRIVGRFTEERPDRVDRLVLLDPAIGGGPSIPPEPTEPWWHGSTDWVRDRLLPEHTDLAFRDAFVAYIGATETRAPNGIRMENFRRSIPVDPTRITRPTLIVAGEAAGKANYMQGTLPLHEFFAQLDTNDRSMTIIPGGGDYLHLQQPRHRLYDTIERFLQPVA